MSSRVAITSLEVARAFRESLLKYHASKPAALKLIEKQLDAESLRFEMDDYVRDFDFGKEVCWDEAVSDFLEYIFGDDYDEESESDEEDEESESDEEDEESDDEE